MFMRRLYFLFIISLVSLTIQAQEEHFTFMGIPIDGNISVFEKQLKKKGFIRDKRFNSVPKELFPHLRIFKGSFADESNVTLSVQFDKISKIVHSLNVIIDCSYKGEMIRKYDSFYSMYKEKYADSYFKEFQTDRKDGVSIGVASKNMKSIIGMIFLAKDNVPNTDDFKITIEYTDTSNFNNSQSNNLDDL